MVMVMIMALSTTEVRFISFVSAESRVSPLHSLGAVMYALRRVVSLPVAFLLQLTVLSSALPPCSAQTGNSSKVKPIRF